jgi:hypothetical protein
MSNPNDQRLQVAVRPGFVVGTAAYFLFLISGIVFAVLSVRLTGPTVIAVAGLATIISFFAVRPLRHEIRKLVQTLGRHPIAAIVLFGLAALAINVLLGTLVHYPIPGVRDEFAYLLGADTFANGSLTNDTHLLWEHFRAGHIIHEPTYQSKYPPAQSFTLALGQYFFGAPAVGVWLSIAVGCAALLWMLQAWLPNRWALLGAFLFLVNFEVFRQWGQSYWGGAVAMIGGALVFGALPRLLNAPRVSTATALSLGVVILAFSRPLEGLLACLPVFVVLFIWIWRSDSPPLAVLLRKVVAPIAVVGVLGATLMAHYNYTVTGDPLRMPYQVWLEQQGLNVSGILTGALTGAGGTDTLPPDYQFPVVDDQSSSLKSARSIASRRAVRAPLIKFSRQHHFFVGVVLGIPLLFVPLGMRRKWLQFAALTCGLVFAGVYSNGGAGFPHYLAPITGLIVLLLIQGARYLNAWRLRGYRTGRTLIRILPIFAFCLGVAGLAMNWARAPVEQSLVWNIERAGMQKTLAATGQQHLVMVRYSPDHAYGEEWTYNESDIDRSQIVWARELTSEKNDKLLKYFADRQIWLLDADVSSGRKLVPYYSSANGPQ